MRSLRRARSRANRIFVLLAALGTGSPGGTAAAESELDWVTFGSLEAGTSTFSTSGFKLAPKESGPALLVSVGQGGRRERVRTLEGGTVEIGRTIGAAAAVFGYQWYRADGVIGLFAGPEAALTTLSDGEDLRRRTMRTGLRVQGEAWLRPTDETLFQASIVAGTAHTSVWARIAGGYRCEETYVGPEAGLYADATGYRKWFFGLHVTDLEVLGLHLRVSAGGQVTPERGLRPYLGLVTWRAW